MLRAAWTPARSKQHAPHLPLLVPPGGSSSGAGACSQPPTVWSAWRSSVTSGPRASARLGKGGDLNVALAYPALWRAAMVYDTLAWLFIGGTVLTLAGLLF